jgi:hypothetical protein
MPGGLAFVLVGAIATGCSATAVRSTGSLPPLPTAPPTTAVGPLTKPVLVATGHDYAAIAHSLITYIDWLEAHHPDPALATEAIQRGTTTFQRAEALLATLRSKHQTIVSIDKRMTFTVAGVYDSMVTLRLSETLLEDRTFDRDHHLLKTERYPGTGHYDVVLLSDGTGRWRIGDVTTVSSDPAIVITR